MRQLKLSVKLWGGFAIVLVLLCAVGYVGVSRLGHLSEEVNDVANIRVPELIVLYDIMEDFDMMARTVRSLPLTSDPEMNKSLKEAYYKAKEELLQQDIPTLEKMLVTAKGKEQVVLIKASVADVIVLNDKAVEAGAANRNEEAADIVIKQIVPVQAKFLKCLKDFQENLAKTSKQDAADAVNAATTGRITMIVIALVALAVGIVIAFFLVRGITRPLNRVIAGLSDGADQVAAAASQVSTAGQSLAEGTAEQASALEETSSSMEEMSSMTKRNADNAAEAKALTHESKEVVEKVDGQMKGMVDAVQAINKSSEETGKIIKTIDEIAFQTNLLALNAAVEAARAGEAGAGFAVVADEVRNLAMRAAEAAKNTSSLIEDTIKAVQKGNELTTATQEAFKENAELAMKVGQLVDEIASASEEQSRGISQVSTAVLEMDKVTQATAANAEESAAAAEELNAQAEQMKVYVGDLITLVGGSGASKATLSSAPKVSSGLRKTLAKRVSRKSVDAEKIIPLKDDGFSDF